MRCVYDRIMYYIVTFDIIDADTNDYDPIYEKAEKHFLGFCHILSTTCLIKSNKTSSEIKEWFKNNTDDLHIRLFVSEYYSEKRSYSLKKTVANDVEEFEN